MPKIEDKMLGLHASKEDQKDFQIACLARRVENLEAMIFEMLRDKVNYQLIEGYQTAIDQANTFTPNSADLRGRGKSIVALLHGKDVKVDKLGWPPVDK